MRPKDTSDEELMSDEIEATPIEQPKRQRLKNVAVAFDGSLSAIAALKMAYENIVDENNILTIICVLPGWNGATGDAFPEMADDHESTKSLRSVHTHLAIVEHHESCKVPERQFMARQVSLLLALDPCRSSNLSGFRTN